MVYVEKIYQIIIIGYRGAKGEPGPKGKYDNESLFSISICFYLFR